MEDVTRSKLQNYFDRNSRWLSPLLSTSMLVIGLFTYQEMSSGQGIALPDWIIKAVLTVGLFTTGLGSAFTFTFSSRLLQVVGISAALALILHSILSGT